MEGYFWRFDDLQQHTCTSGWAGAALRNMAVLTRSRAPRGQEECGRACTRAIIPSRETVLIEVIGSLHVCVRDFF